jgi:hypothetical protein
MSKILPLSVVARRLRVTRAWLQAEVEAGRIPALKAGSRILADPDAVEAALLTRARGEAPTPPATAARKGVAK